MALSNNAVDVGGYWTVKGNVERSMMGVRMFGSGENIGAVLWLAVTWPSWVDEALDSAALVASEVGA